MWLPCWNSPWKCLEGLIMLPGDSVPCRAMLWGGITIPEESDLHEEQQDHRNMKPVESSGGNGSQSWLSNKDSNLQKFWGETFRSKLQLSLWETWENYYFVRSKREISWAGLLESLFSLPSSPFFFSRKNQKNYKEKRTDTDNMLLPIRRGG